ncbi:uncharacterized protein LOC124264279 [Haliotis rubra]|uniref:uncharacterized protein LOC124264279 n=1 Tax=Haliotis rubra TaxID=36100 RepID=UPI001EE53AE6|nr:uncharacterized protein LOC124264279 [Haliotis rubra]
MTHNTALERITNPGQHMSIQKNIPKMDQKDIRCQGDVSPQDPPNSDCTVILDKLPGSNSESKSYLHLESSTLDESCLRKRKRILLSCHKQILAKVREQRLVSKNLCQMFSQRSPTPIPNDEQFQNGTDSSHLIVSVRPISQTAAGSMKLSYTIKDGFLSTSLQEAGQSIGILEDGTSIPAGTNLQDAGPECLQQMKIAEYPKDDTSIPAGTNLQEAGPECLEQMKITAYPKDDTSISAGTNLQEAGPECLEQMKITEYPKDDTSIPAGTNLQESGPFCLDQIRIPEIFEDDPCIPVGTILQDVWAEHLGQIGIPVCFHGNQKVMVPAETVLQLAGVECLEQFNKPDSFQDDPNGLGRTVGEIQNCSSSLENLEWVRSLGSEHNITVLYASPSVDNGINNRHYNEVIEEQYQQPVKKRKVKK